MSNLVPACFKQFVSPGLALLTAIVLLAPCTARATPYVVTLVQQGSNVVVTGSGAIDLTGLTFDGAYSYIGSEFGPAYGSVLTGTQVPYIDGYTGSSGPTNFGSGGFASPISTSGDGVGIIGNPAYYGFTVLWVPQGYVSETALTSDATLANASFASLGVTPGTYTWTWGTGADQSFTLTTMTAVPEPAALGMFGFGALLIGAFVGLRRRTA